MSSQATHMAQRGGQTDIPYSQQRQEMQTAVPWEKTAKKNSASQLGITVLLEEYMAGPNTLGS